MGPTALFDKSFLQSLSLDEAVFLDHFFRCVIAPVFYVETLADLEKAVREGRTPEQEVGLIADKVPEMHSELSPAHVGLALQDLIQGDVPMDGRLLLTGGRSVKVAGHTGYIVDETDEQRAFQRWRDGNFLEVERSFAKSWREQMSSLDLVAFASRMRAAGLDSRFCKTLDDANKMARRVINDYHLTPNCIKLVLALLGNRTDLEEQALTRWRNTGRRSFILFAPYTAFVLCIEIFFQLAIGASQIAPERNSNRTDIAYLNYLPFCNIFISQDKLHKRCSHYFLRPDQSFVWGPELKKDLAMLVAYYSVFPEAEKDQGLLHFAATPPPHDKEFLVGKLWDKYLAPWRNRVKTPPALLDNKELKGFLDTFSSAPTVPESEVGSEEPAMLSISRMVRTRKGRWWQVPKDLAEKPKS